MIADQLVLIKVLDAVSTAIIILNQERQIVFGNKAFLDILDKEDLTEITGMRLGEVIGCVHANESIAGCGTTAFCSKCGAVNAMLSSLNGNTDVQECRIILEEDPKALDLRVMSSPIKLQEEEFAVFSVQDIAHEKRKEVLEKIFMHDLLSTAGGLQGVGALLATANEETFSKYTTILNNLANKLVDEIEAQRQILQAEDNSLSIKIGQSSSLEILRSVKETLMNHDVAKDRIIVVDPEAREYSFLTDKTLLMRVLANMTKNALEAIKSGEKVTLSCNLTDNKIRFSVHNPGEMSRDASLQIFQRSFSTKGTGRGLGTYSIKIFSEQYLKGKVGFFTSPEAGTVFYGDYPVVLTRD